MTSRLLTIALVVSVTVGLLFEAGRAALTPEGRWREWLQLLVAQQMADTFARQVQVGPISDLSLLGVTVSDVAVAEDWLLAEGAIARADRVRLSYDLAGMVRGDVAPAAAIDRVELTGAWVHAVRERDGTLNLQRLLPRPVRPTPPEERFRGVVAITDATVIYDDYALPTAHGAPLNLELTGIDAELDARRIGWIAITGSANERLGRFGALEIRGEAEADSGFVWADLRLADVDVGWWFDTLVPTDAVTVSGGRAQIAGTLAVPPKAKGGAATFSAEARVRGATVRLAALNHRPIHANVDGFVTPGGVQVRHLAATSGGVQLEASGLVADFEAPVLDARFELEAARIDDVLALVPGKDEGSEALAGLAVSGPVVASGQLAGPVTQANLSLQASAPGAVRYADDRLGEVAAQGVEVRVDLLDLLESNVRAQAKLTSVEATDLTPLRAALPEDLAGEPELAPLQDVQADVLWSARTSVAHTQLRVPRVAVGDVAVEDLSADVALAGDILRVSDLRARPLDAELAADAVVDLSEPEAPWVWARGDIVDLDLGRLSDLPGLSAAEGLGGTASAHFAGSWEAGKPQVVAQVVVADGGFSREGEQYHLESLRGIVTADSDGITLAGATFSDPMGTGWVRGVIPFEGDLAARFAIAGVDLARVQERFKMQADDLRGQAFVAGSLHGSFENPQFDATVRGYDIGEGRWSVDAVTADISGETARLRVEDLYASLGRIVVHAAGTLTAQGTPESLFEALAERDYEIDGTVVVAGPMDERALTLAQLEDLDLHGAAHAEIAVGGTLERPSARGEVRLGYAHFETIATDDATLRVKLQGDILELEEMRVPVGEALVTGQASITSLYDEPLLAASVSAENVVLQDLAPLQELNLPVSGRIDLPYVSLNGPLDDLKGLAQIQATELMLGDEQLGGVSAMAVLDGKTLRLPTTTLALAEGTLSFSVGLQLDERRVLPGSEVSLRNVSLPELLRAGVPLAQRFADPPPEQLAEGERPLSKQLASLALRLGGRLDSTISAAGVIPSAPEEGASAEDAIRAVLEALPATAELALRDASVDGRPLPDTKLQASVTEDAAVQVTLESTEGEALITADGTWQPDGVIDALIDVSALDMAVLRPWIPETVESIGGRLNLTVQASHTLDAPELMGSVDVLEPEVHGARFDIVSAPIISYADGVLRVDSLVIRKGDEEIFVDGMLPFDWANMSVPPDEPLQVVARTEKTDLGILPPILADVLTEGPGDSSPLARVKATGTIDSAVTLAGTLRRPELSGSVSMRAPGIDTPWLSSTVEDLALDVTFRGAEGKTEVEDLRIAARVESTTLEIGPSKPEGAPTGETEPSPPRPVAELQYYDLAHMHENVFHLQASVSAPQQRFGDLVARRVRGTVALDTSAPGQQTLKIKELGANFGDGSVLLDGSVIITSFLPGELANNEFDLALVADRARPRYGNLFLGRVDGEIVGRNPAPGEPVKFSGGFTISHAVIGVPRPQPGAGGELRGMPRDFPSPQFDLALGIGPDVRVETAGIRAPLKVTDQAVVFRGTPQRPELRALVAAQEGEASMPGGLLDIAKGELRLLIAPALGLSGRTPPVKLRVDGSYQVIATQTIESTVIDGRQVGPITVHMAVDGTLPLQEFAHVRVTSDPPLSEEQILTLVGMAPFSGAQMGGEGGNIEDVLSQQFVSALGAAFRLYVFQPFEEELKELLGLSVLEVTFAFDQPLAVRIGGYLMENLLITYRTAAVGSGEDYDLEVSYRVDRRYHVGFATDERNNARVFVEHTYSF